MEQAATRKEPADMFGKKALQILQTSQFVSILYFCPDGLQGFCIIEEAFKNRDVIATLLWEKRPAALFKKQWRNVLLSVSHSYGYKCTHTYAYTHVCVCVHECSTCIIPATIAALYFSALYVKTPDVAIPLTV
jgi:hypothetical protein